VGYNFVAEMRVYVHSFSHWRHQNISARSREIRSYCSSRSSKNQGRRPWCQSKAHIQLPCH